MQPVLYALLLPLPKKILYSLLFEEAASYFNDCKIFKDTLNFIPY